MAVDSQLSQEAGAKGRVKCTPLQGTEYANKTPKPKYSNLEEWFQDVSIADRSFPFRRQTLFHYPLAVVSCLRWMLIIEFLSFVEF